MEDTNTENYIEKKRNDNLSWLIFKRILLCCILISGSSCLVFTRNLLTFPVSNFTEILNRSNLTINNTL